MSSLLTLIVLGQAHSYGTVPTNLSSATNSTQVTSTVPSLIQSKLESYHKARHPDYTYTPGVGAHRLHSERVTWNTARRICEEQEGHLAIINSIAEAEAISQLLKNSGLINSYVGVHDLYQENEFVTIHGESLAQTGYKGWRTGEPNNFKGKENCMVVNVKGKLVDVSCKNHHSFVCELPYIQPYVLRVPGHFKTA